MKRRDATKETETFGLQVEWKTGETNIGKCLERLSMCKKKTREKSQIGTFPSIIMQKSILFFMLLTATKNVFDISVQTSPER